VLAKAVRPAEIPFDVCNFPTQFLKSPPNADT